MSRYEHLPLYKDAYDFNIYFYKLSRGFPKDFKYGLSQEIRDLASHLLDQIILANNYVSKERFLQEGELDVERIKIKVRILKDMEVVNGKSYSFISESLVKISKQIGAWKTWSEKGRKQSS